MTMNSPKKIPTLVGIMLVAALVFAVGLAFNFIFEKKTTASKTAEPSHVEITNVSESGFSVTWMTADPATGAVALEDAGLPKKTLFDERDSGGKLETHISHSVTATGLQPGKQYSFIILSNGTKYDANGSPYNVSTAPALDPTLSGFEPAFGKTAGTDGRPLTDALVYITLEGSQTLSTLVRDNGAWLIPLNLIRTGDLSGYVPFTDRIDEQVTVRKGNDEAVATSDTLNDSPVPDMTIGKSYDFRKQQAKAEKDKQVASLPVSQSNGNKNVLGEQTKSMRTRLYTVTITQPKDGASLVSNLPLFQGTGVPGKLVSVTLGIKDPTTFSVRIGEDGIWRFTPKKPLAPGKQSVTITSVDSRNKNIALTNTFDILKSGTQVLGDATPSGTLAPTPTEEPVITGTPIPTEEPVLSPTPEPEISETVTPTPPVTGSAEVTVLILAVSAAFILGGFALSIF